MDATTLLFIGLAAFVIWRLWSVLGQRTGAERPSFDPIVRRDQNGAPRGEGGEVIPLPGARNPSDAASAVPDPDRWKGIAEPGTPLANGLDAVAAADPSFNAKVFGDGARAAYEMIVTAFAAGDRGSLKNLLAREVYDGFEGAIREREQRGEKVETTFVSIDKAEIVDAQLRGRSAQITVRFVSSLITATRDKTGKIVDGNPEKVVEVTDVWTFARDVRARDPNWQLVATEAGQ